MGLVRVVPVDVIVELVKPIVDKVNNSLSQDIIDKTDSKEKIEGVKSDVVKE